MLLRSGKETQLSEPKINSCNRQVKLTKRYQNSKSNQGFWNQPVLIMLMLYIILLIFPINTRLNYLRCLVNSSIKNHNISYQNLENYYLDFTNKSAILAMGATNTIMGTW